MTTSDLTQGSCGPAGSRRRLVLAGAVLVVGALAVAVVDRGGPSSGSTRLGPTVAVAARDLATTLEASGTLRRSAERVVAHASPIPSGGGDDPSASPDGGGDSPAVEPVSYVPEDATPSDTSPSGTAPSGTAPADGTTTTTSPCRTTSTPSTATTSSTPSTTTPCPPSTTTTTVPTSTTTVPTSTTTVPTSTTTPTTPTTTAPHPGAGGPASPGDGGDGSDGGDGGEVPSAILTGLLDIGATADRGTVLYTADEQPVVALLGDLPAWRTLEDGVDGGADVRQLEENLVALGYGAVLDVDETFTAGTAAAVEAWETDLGRAAPDGVVSLGDVVFLTEPGDVLGHEAAVGDTVDAGSPVLTVGSEQRIVVADVDATEAGGWTPGTTVRLGWADGNTGGGTVVGAGRNVAEGQVELIVAVGAGESGAGTRRSGAAATVAVVDARREGVVAVPVAAVVDDDGSPAVRVAQPDGPDRVVPVEIGLVAGGWVEITAGLEGGEDVRLPG